MRKTVEVVVDDKRYQVEQLSTTEGLRIYNRLAHVLGGAINGELKAAAEQDAGATDEEKASRAGERVVRMLLSSLSLIPEEMQLSLGVTFSKTCKVALENGAWMPLEPMYDDHFAGRFLHWTLWLLECLKVNFADFLERARRVAPPAEPTPSA